MISNKNIVGPSISAGEIISITLIDHDFHIPLTENLYPEYNRISAQNIQSIPRSEWFESDKCKSVELFSYKWIYGWKEQTIWIGSYTVSARYFQFKSSKFDFLVTDDLRTFIVETLKSSALNASFFPDDEEKTYAEDQIPLSINDIEIYPALNACLTQSGHVNIGLPNLHAYIALTCDSFIQLDFSIGKLGNDHLPTYPLTDEELQAFKREVMMEILDGIKITPNE